MRCSKAKRYLELSLDGEINATRQSALNRHLQACSACQTWHANAKKLHHMLAGAPQPEFPTWIHAQILDKVHRLDNVRPSFVRRFKLAPVTATLAIMLSFWTGAKVGIAGYNNSISQFTEATSNPTTVSMNEFGEHSLLDSYYNNGDYNE